jgi:transcriptional regulator with XRE-family HTH domain
MHTPEVRQKFIERRAQGWTLVRIASELGVAKSTLIEWSRQLRFEIQNQCALELDDLQNRLLGPTQQRATALAERLAAVETELRKRNLSELSTPRLYALSASLRRQIEQTIGDIRFASPLKDIPNNEYVEEVQEWKP